MSGIKNLANAKANDPSFDTGGLLDSETKGLVQDVKSQKQPGGKPRAASFGKSSGKNRSF